MRVLYINNLELNRLLCAAHSIGLRKITAVLFEIIS